MEELMNAFKNWRCDIFVLLVCLSALCLFCEAESLKALFASKAVGLGIAYVAYRLFTYWDKRGQIDELSEESE